MNLLVGIFSIVITVIIFLLFSTYISEPLESKDKREDINAYLYSLVPGDQVNYLVEKYFKVQKAKSLKAKILKKKEDAFLKSLPKDSKSCSDRFNACQKWALNGECTINPAFMFYNCASSCQACKMSPSQKYAAAVIYNERPAKKCIYHGEPYPELIHMELQQYFDRV